MIGEWQAAMQHVSVVESSTPLPEYVIGQGRQDDCVDALLRNARLLQEKQPTATGPATIAMLESMMNVGVLENYTLVDFGYNFILRQLVDP